MSKLENQKGALPSVFQTDILERAIGTEGVRALFEKYKECRKSVDRTMVDPTVEDYRIVELVRQNGFNMSAVAKILNVPPHKVQTAVNHVARHNLLRS